MTEEVKDEPEVVVDGFLTHIVQKPENKLFATGLVMKVPDPTAPHGERWFIQVYDKGKVIKRVEIGVHFTSARNTINSMIVAAGGTVPERPRGE